MVRALGSFDGGENIGEGRSDDNIAIADFDHQGFEGAEKRAGLLLILIHLPIAGDYAATFGFAHLLVNASTPGSLRPPRNSRDAPPPVEM